MAQFGRDGYLIFPELFSQAEVAVLRREVARLSKLESEEVVPRAHRRDQEHLPGCMRKTAGRARHHSARWCARHACWCARHACWGPVQQVLGGEVYVYHIKINAKPAVEGTIWMWHQDYKSWSKDGCPTPKMATFNVMLNDTVEFSGGLYIIPGSHKLGLLESSFDTSTGYKLRGSPKKTMIEVMRNSPPPVAVTGRAGTGVLFHCNACVRAQSFA